MSAGRQQRYAVFLSGFNYSIEFRKSKSHANADGLSRLPLPITTPVNGDNFIADNLFYSELMETIPLNATIIAKESCHDPQIAQMLIQNGQKYSLSVLQNHLQQLTVSRKHSQDFAIASDNGSTFTSNEFKDFTKRIGIKHITTAPFTQLPMDLQKAEIYPGMIWRRHIDQLVSTPRQENGKSTKEIIPTMSERNEHFASATPTPDAVPIPSQDSLSDQVTIPDPVGNNEEFSQPQAEYPCSPTRMATHTSPTPRVIHSEPTNPTSQDGYTTRSGREVRKPHRYNE
ncbi:Retrovirus-related Pol polyprotein from transposon 17.6 [Biomphalaria pfeifferi]|uniref:Retrovirus-related Pol polyprotein from transposon 17.6 n=1 Tax=Biomphalaria pfeifferi TaxID=112525 RepID=A0AAD8CBR4_BIOPF|nr:Retrovirus-related Pol polyprotein from transposon 17.6 [Biomphalaria pfeifferi]